MLRCVQCGISISDLELLSIGMINDMFIEMKNGRAGVVSDNQKRMMMILTKHGYKCVVCRTHDDFFAQLHEYAPEVKI